MDAANISINGFEINGNIHIPFDDEDDELDVSNDKSNTDNIGDNAVVIPLDDIICDND